MGILPEHLLNRAALHREAVQLGKEPETFRCGRAVSTAVHRLRPLQVSRVKSINISPWKDLKDIGKEPPNIRNTSTDHTPTC